MKIVFFGGSGFLGSHVCDKLSDAGHDVTIVDLRPSPYLRPFPYNSRPLPCGKKRACAFLCTRSFLMSQYVVIVVPTK